MNCHPTGKDVSLSLNLPEETANEVKLYARFLKATHESALSAITNECIRRTLKQDSDFQTWKSDPANTRSNRGGTFLESKFRHSQRRRLSQMTMQRLQLLITEDELRDHQGALGWGVWTLVFFSGFVLGATADLIALWLFTYWMHR